MDNGTRAYFGAMLDSKRTPRRLFGGVAVLATAASLIAAGAPALPAILIPLGVVLLVLHRLDRTRAPRTNGLEALQPAVAATPVLAETRDPATRWRRKTSHELLSDVRARRRRGFNPLPALMLAAVGATFWSGLRALIGSPRHRRPPVSVEQALWELPLMLLLLFVILYIRQAGFRAGRRPIRVTICTRCYDVAVYRGDGPCPCGGTLEDADQWTHNQCPSCGYDLRAATNRCPECGTFVRDGPE